ncbi:MAG: GspH/FimT family pseudopilin [Betaproteobacteria bacterium]
MATLTNSHASGFGVRSSRRTWTIGGFGGARGSAGFTLVEVLVTLIVIGVAVGLVSLALGHDSAAQLRQESERLRSALEHAAQVAQWRRLDLVWQADAQSYRFLRPSADGKWDEESDEILAVHKLPADARIRAVGAAGGAVPPEVTLHASGRNDPYTLTLDSPAGSWTIRADPLNRVRIATTP